MQIEAKDAVAVGMQPQDEQIDNSKPPIELLTLEQCKQIYKEKGFKSALDATKYLLKIKKEKKELKLQLEQFRNQFKLNHNRDIQFKKDILPM